MAAQITQVITALPAAPDPTSDMPDQFSLKAAASVLAQRGLPAELNTFSAQANALSIEVSAALATSAAAASTATTKASETLTSANNASNSAASALDSKNAAAASAATIGTAAAFSDANPIAKNAADNTKQLKVNLAALVTGTVVTLTLRALSGTIAFLSDLAQFLTPMTFYNSGTTNALSMGNGGHQRWAPNTGAQTLSITGWPAAGLHGELHIEGVNLGASTITWPTINWIKFDGSTTTTFSANGITLRASGIDNVILWSRDGGSTIYGKIIR